MPDDPRTRLRAICLALPEAEERETWGDPTWRVHDRIFAMEKRGDGRISVWLKAPPGAQDVLVTADPARFFVPPYVGHRGWIGVRLDATPDWDELAALVARSFRLTAPKRIAARLGSVTGCPQPVPASGSMTDGAGRRRAGSPRRARPRLRHAEARRTRVIDARAFRHGVAPAIGPSTSRGPCSRRPRQARSFRRTARGEAHRRSARS